MNTTGRSVLTPGSPQKKAMIPARTDPTKTIPMVSPGVRPFARLAEPSVQAEIFTAAAILLKQLSTSF
jgi:hypothetical protein